MAILFKSVSKFLVLVCFLERLIFISIGSEGESDPASDNLGDISHKVGRLNLEPMSLSCTSEKKSEEAATYSSIPGGVPSFTGCSIISGPLSLTQEKNGEASGLGIEALTFSGDRGISLKGRGINLIGGALNLTGSVNKNLTVSKFGTFYMGDFLKTDILQVPGNYVQAGGSCTVKVGCSGRSDLIWITGKAALGGVLNIRLLEGDYEIGKTYTYTVLKAEGGLGKTIFDAVTSSSPQFTCQARYDENNVYLDLVNIG